MRDEFVRECEAICQNRSVLCNIVLDLCYTRSASKKFAWDICGEDIVNNLLSKNGGTISIPVYDEGLEGKTLVRPGLDALPYLVIGDVELREKAPVRDVVEPGGGYPFGLLVPIRPTAPMPS